LVNENWPFLPYHATFSTGATAVKSNDFFKSGRDNTEDIINLPTGTDAAIPLTAELPAYDQERDIPVAFLENEAGEDKLLTIIPFQNASP
jgi:hypothetical protein